MIENLLSTEQTCTKNEKSFLDYYYDNTKLYPFKTDNFKFVIISSKEKITKEMVYTFFEGLLNDILCFEKNNYLLVIYHNKYRISFSDLHNSLSEDYGQLIKLFEGFSINIKNIHDLEYVINMYNQYLDNEKNDYYSISDLIIKVSKDKPTQLNNLKKIILRKYLYDQQFEKMIKAMFKNNLNISKTAYDIYMHRNTINNKIDMLARDTGLEMQRFKDAVSVFELFK